jgi:hypothetical protein
MTSLLSCRRWYESRRSVVFVLLLTHFLAGACALSERGTWVEVSVSTQGRPQTGEALSLAVVVSELEILPCEPELATRLLQTLFPVAQAHTVDSPTRLGTPMVVNVRAQQSMLAGVLEPPPGQYCELRVFIGPADADATGLDLHPWMLNRSVALSRDTDVLMGTSAAFEFRVVFPPTTVEAGAPIALQLQIQPDSVVLPPEERRDDEPLRAWLLSLPQLTTVQVGVP